MAMIKPQRYSIADFLTLPEIYPPLEFFGGRVIQKQSPKLPHGIIQGEVFYNLRAHVQPSRLGQVYIELRCVFGGSSHVFDLSFSRLDR